MAHNPYDQGSPSPTVAAVASFSFIIGLAALVGFYPIASGPIALGCGIWSMIKGARGYQPIVGIAGGAIAFGWQILRLVLVLI